MPAGVEVREIRPTVGRLVAAVGVGLVIGFAGTAVHRAGTALPWGLLLAGTLTAFASVFVRAAFSRPAVALFTGGVVLVILGLTYAGPGNDVLVTGEGTSMAWLVLASLCALAGWAAPARWFTDHRAPRSTR